ncbi:MAG: tRNA epoxyqueuosine(34) reductase QueG [Acidimicrobiales bacterium]
MLSRAYVDELCATGIEAGLTRVGVASADPFDDVRAVLEQRKAAGLHGGMQFTYRNPARSTDPARALSGARSIVVGARSYPARLVAGPIGSDTGVPPRPVARVARYATDDHYRLLRDGLHAIAARLQADGWRARVLADDNALVDRAAAHRAGLGWYGKNANLLLPGIGSLVVLGAVLTDAELPATAQPAADGCGPCRRCLDSCPTGAIVTPGIVDARRCLAWLLQAEGDFPEEHREALGDRIYGCDDCQEVCPPNRGALRDGPPVRGGTVELIEMLTLDDDQLLARFGRWYIPRRDPRYLRRNALVVLGNVGDVSQQEVLAAVRRYLHGDDPMLRRHAAWAAGRLGLVAEATA